MTTRQFCITFQPSEITDSLRRLESVIHSSDISAFEMEHSGIVGALTQFLIGTDGQLERNDRLMLFGGVFMGLREVRLF